MSKQTAVEWLAEQINGKSINYPFSTYADITISIPIELFEQAKQKEKEQLIAAWKEGIYHALDKDYLPKPRYKDAEDYYNKVYNQP